MLKRRLILIILFSIGIFSSLSFFLLLQYFDPYLNPRLAVTFLTMSFVFSITSFLTILFYFFKKIYYRGDVGIYHVKSSVRQGFFISVFFCSAVVFQVFHIPFYLPLFLTGVTLILIEFLIQGL